MPRNYGVNSTPFCPHLAGVGSSALYLACCVLLLLIAQPFAIKSAYAQSTSATLSGIVTDQNGDVVPGAKIEVLNPSQAIRRHATTNDDGMFTVPALNPGNYRVKAEAPGFAVYEIDNVVLNVNDQVRIAIGLMLPKINQTIQVANIDTINESPAVGVVVDRRIVENMPLNGRSFHPLLQIVPGYVPAVTNSGDPGQFSFNGQRTNTNAFMVDGVSANVSASSSLISGQMADGSLPGLSAFGGTNNLASVDAVEEFKVLTSTYSAEFGRTPGAQISIVTRSGTNEFHGSFFEYFRNDVLDANDWFFNANGRAKTPLRQNIFGGVLGGPVLIPRFGEGGQRFYNDRNRTFFFFSYEGFRLRQPFFLISDVPSLAARQNASPALRQLLNAFPLPNGPENPATNMAQFSAAFSNPSTLDATSIRIDHTTGQKFSIFGRYNDSPSEGIQRGSSSSINTLSSVTNRTRTLTLGTTSVLSPTITNELRGNYTRVTGSNINTLDSFGGAAIPPDSFFFPSFTEGQTAFFSLSLIPGRFATLLHGEGAENKQRQINIINNFSVVTGGHSLKFGVDYRRLSPIIGPRAYTQNLFASVDQLLSGSTLATVAAEAEPREPVFTNLSLYAQDVWHVNSRLTLTYGLRWELNPAPSESNGNSHRTLTGTDSPSTLALAPVGTPLFETTYNNFAPRFGLSYQLRQKPGKETTLRGGAGIYYDLGTGQVANAFGTGAFPFSSFKFLPGVPFPLSPADLTPLPLGTFPSIFPIIVVAYEPGFKLPYTIQFNAAVEQSLGAGQHVSLSYVGARGRRLVRKEAAFTPEFFADVITNGDTSDYDALQLQFQRRLTERLQVIASYSFAKSIDTASKESFALNGVGQIDPRQDRGPSDFDLRHSFNAAVSYDLPAPEAGRIGNAFLRNWSLDSLIRLHSAPPVNILTGHILFGLATVARPDLVAGVPIYLDDASAPGGRRINRAAFVPPPGGPFPTRQGTLGRNALRGFPFSQVDLTVRRQFNFNDRVNLQFRTDFFNILNHPNFGDICDDLSSCGSNFGASMSMFGRSLGAGGINGGFSPLFQVGGPRSIQFSLKLQY